METNEPRLVLTDGEKDWIATADWINRITHYALVVTALFLAGAFLFVFLPMPGGHVYIDGDDAHFAGVPFGEAMKAAASKFKTIDVIKTVARRTVNGKKDLFLWMLDALKRKLGRIFGF